MYICIYIYIYIYIYIDSAVDIPFEGPDPKVVEFLRILEEYRVKCEEEGNYLEAGRAHKQLGVYMSMDICVCTYVCIYICIICIYMHVYIHACIIT
jgi:hypothetical protein